MKSLKTLDVTIQVALIMISLLFFTVHYREAAFVVFYFGLGGYQLVTNYIKLLAGYRSKGRKLYNYCLVACYIGFAISYASHSADDDTLLIFGFFMLVAGLILAFYNLGLSVNELNQHTSASPEKSIEE